MYYVREIRYKIPRIRYIRLTEVTVFYRLTSHSNIPLFVMAWISSLAKRIQ